jgi:sec-independent protein translocase protein TatA
MHSIYTVVLLFDVSGGEFLVILLFILMFFGSKNIPDLARGLGRGYRQLKDATNSIKREIQTGAGDVNLKDIGDSIKRPLDKHIDELKKSIAETDKDIQKDLPRLDQTLDDDINKS